METILKVIDISKSFVPDRSYLQSGKQEKNYILKALNLELRQSEITGLIGSNGAGKSTLLNILSRLVDFDSGEILYAINTDQYIPLQKKRPHQLAELGIGRLFQGLHVFEEMSILDNMLVADNNRLGELPFSALLYFRKNEKVELQRIEKARQIFSQFWGSDNYFWNNRNDLAKNLSYGQQRILGLLRLFMAEYRLILLDEPTAGINPTLMDKIQEMIHTLAQQRNAAILLVEHDMDFLRRVSDRCVFLSEGRVVISGSPNEVLSNEYVKHSYIGA